MYEVEFLQPLEEVAVQFHLLMVVLLKVEMLYLQAVAGD
jgi:hypothetical protein